ncbi:MAG TPA: histidine phosphatase family protein [Acidimicrobiia bacterium]
MDLVLVRHAEPVRTVAGTVDGPADPGLTPLGFEQAQRLAEWLAYERIDAVLSSPMRRARETAEPLAALVGLEVEIVDGLVEYDAASDDYIPMDELQASGDPRWIAMVEGRWEEFGADPAHVFKARVAQAVEEIIDRHAGRRVVAVCHGGVVNCALASILDIDRYLWFEPGYTSISRVAASRSGVRSVVSLNERAHLEATRHRTGDAP